MNIALPKDLKGITLDRITILDMNTFDVDVLLGPLFFLIVSGGSSRVNRLSVSSDDASNKEATDLNYFIDRLSQHPDVAGFDNNEGTDLLDRFMRTTSLLTSRKGQTRTTFQLEGIVARTLPIFKPRLPSDKSLRQVDIFLYQILVDQLGGDHACRSLFKSIFGKGAVVSGPPNPDGAYDGHT